MQPDICSSCGIPVEVRQINKKVIELQAVVSDMGQEMFAYGDCIKELTAKIDVIQNNTDGNKMAALLVDVTKKLIDKDIAEEKSDADIQKEHIKQVTEQSKQRQLLWLKIISIVGPLITAFVTYYLKQ